MAWWLSWVAPYAQLAPPDSGGTGHTASTSTGGSYVWTADCDTRIDPDDTAPEHDSDVDSAVEPEMDSAAADSGYTGPAKAAPCGCSAAGGQQASAWGFGVLVAFGRRRAASR
ncbi:MAG: hypothetical protein ABMA64_12385 [Myxococcota bacterium]